MAATTGNLTKCTMDLNKYARLLTRNDNIFIPEGSLNLMLAKPRPCS